MAKFFGYLFSKLAAIGTKSQGPIYFLQQFDYNEVMINKKTHLWQNDPALHPFLNELVTITGDININRIDYTKIEKNPVSKSVQVKEGLELELELAVDNLPVSKKPGNPNIPKYLELTLKVKWPYKSIWLGACPTSQIYDFTIEDKDKIIWRWSDNKVFSFMITPVQISGGDFHLFREKWSIDPQKIHPGNSYKITALFIASGQQVTKELNY